MTQERDRKSALEASLNEDPRVEMPEIFCSAETERPFETCIDCEVQLADESRGGYYFVQKTIVRREPVFEFAMCLTCYWNLQREFSRETHEALEQFFEDNVQPFENIEVESVDEFLDECLTCLRPRADCHRHTIVGFATGLTLLAGTGPLMICDSCENRMSELISAKTRREWDRFVEDHFDGPPGIEQDWPHHIPAMI